jgi:hypothetical protein
MWAGIYIQLRYEYMANNYIAFLLSKDDCMEILNTKIILLLSAAAREAALRAVPAGAPIRTPLLQGTSFSAAMVIMAMVMMPALPRIAAMAEAQAFPIISAGHRKNTEKAA